MREIVIGDIHGCYEELMKLLKKLKLRAEDKLIALGDIVDRGPDSWKVYKYLKNRPNTIVLMGNHERKHLRKTLSYAQEIVKLQFGAQYPEFLKWLASLPYSYESQSALVVHAFFENGVALDQQREDVLSGSTSGDRYLKKLYGDDQHWYEYYSPEAKPIVVGHHVVGEDIKLLNKSNVYAIDTGACHKGRLSALILGTFEVVQVEAALDYWKIEMKKWQLAVLKNKPWCNLYWADYSKLLDKFSYKKEVEIQDFIAHKRAILVSYEGGVQALKLAIEKYIQDFIDHHGLPQFKKMAGSHSEKALLFMAQKGVLQLKDVQAYSSTPRRWKALKEIFLVESVQ